MPPFGETRLNTIDDISGLISSVRERIGIVAARQRMNLKRADVAEFESAVDELEEIHAIVLDLRETISDAYAARIGRRVSAREQERRRQAAFIEDTDLYQQLL